MTDQQSTSTSATTNPGMLFVTAAATISASDLPGFYANVAQWLLGPQTGKSSPKLVGGDDTYVTAVVTLPADHLPDFYLQLAGWIDPEAEEPDLPRGKSSPR